MSFGFHGNNNNRRLTAAVGPTALQPLSNSQANSRQSIASFVPHGGYAANGAAASKPLYAPGQTLAMPLKPAGRMSMAGSAGRVSMAGKNGNNQATAGKNSERSSSMYRNNSHGRASMAPSFGRPSMAPRPSMGGGAVADMSMARGGGGGNKRGCSMAKNDDPRNVSEKSYVNRACHEIIGFLVENHYDKDIDMKKLKHPLTRDFVDVFAFLVYCLDEQFQFAEGDPRVPRKLQQSQQQQLRNRRTMGMVNKKKNSKEEVQEEPPMVAKRILEYLRYPSPLKDNAFKNIGVSHTWKDIVAAMHWMVDLLRYVREKKTQDYEQEAISQENPFNSENQEENDYDLLLKFLPRAYQEFMAMEDDVQDEEAISVVVGELRKKFNAQNEQCQQQTDFMFDEMNNMENELNENYRDKPSQLAELKEKHGLFQNDIGKMTQFVEELGAAIGELHGTRTQRSDQLLSIQTELDKYTHHKNELLDQISRQELSPEDVRRLNHELIKLEDAQRSLQQRRSEQDKDVWQAESDQHDAMEQLRRVVASYNQQAGLLGLMPFYSSPIAQQQQFNYELAIDSTQLDAFFANDGSSQQQQQRMLSMTNGKLPSITNHDPAQLKTNLRTLREQITRQIHETQNEALYLKEEADKANEQRQDKRDEIQSLEKQLKKLEVEYKSERETWRNRLQQVIFDTEEVERDVYQLRQDDSIVTQIESQKTAMKSLVDEHQMLERKFAEDRREMARILDQTCDLMSRHKSHVSESLSTLEYASDSVLHQLTAEGNADVDNTMQR